MPASVSGGSAASPGRAVPTHPAATSARELVHEATFADVVSAARQLDGADASDSSAGCLLRAPSPADSGWTLTADVAVAVRPLPDAPAKLGERAAAERGPVAVLSRWGERGPRTARLALVTFTSAPPMGGGEVLVLVAGEAGVYVRSTASPAPSPAVALPWPSPDLSSPIHGRPDASALVITADAGLPLTRLARLLRALPADTPPVSLAVALAPGTELPAPVVGRASDAPLCPDGLPDAAPNATAGNLAPEQAAAVLHPLASQADQCIASFPEAAGGGRLQVWLRVGPGGKVSNACIARDSIGSVLLRRCILDQLEALRFPDPGGTVDLSFPLTVQAAPGIRQKGLCE